MRLRGLHEDDTGLGRAITVAAVELHMAAGGIPLRASSPTAGFAASSRQVGLVSTPALRTQGWAKQGYN